MHRGRADLEVVVCSPFSLEKWLWQYSRQNSSRAKNYFGDKSSFTGMLSPSALLQLCPGADICITLLLRAETWSTKFKLKISENFQAEIWQEVLA